MKLLAILIVLFVVLMLIAFIAPDDGDNDGIF